MSRFSHRLVATAVLAALSLPVLAQTSAPTQATQATPAAAQAEPGRRMQHDHPMRRHAPDRAQMQQKMQERMAHHMAQFKEKLQLSPAQEPAWNTLTASLQPGQRHARLDRQGMEQLTTPERIDRMRAMRIQRAAEADRRGEAVKTFYAALTPAQQKTFDAQSQRMLAGKHGHAGEGRQWRQSHDHQHPGHGHGMQRHGAAPSAAAAPADH